MVTMLSQLKELRDVSLSGNSLSAAIVSSLARLPLLRILDFECALSLPLEALEW